MRTPPAPHALSPHVHVHITVIWTPSPFTCATRPFPSRACTYNGHVDALSLHLPLAASLVCLADCLAGCRLALPTLPFPQLLSPALLPAPPQPCCGLLEAWPHLLDTHVALLSIGDSEHDYPLGCAAGFYGDSDAHAKQTTPQCSGPCPAGRRCASATIEPVVCGAGTYCGIGSSSEISCPTGTFSQTLGLTAVPLCQPCHKGHYCFGGQEIACSVGSYSEATRGGGPLICRSCPEASTTGATAATSVQECICEKLYYNLASNGTVAPTCVDCPLGANCTVAGTTLRTLNLHRGYWRPHENAS